MFRFLCAALVILGFGCGDDGAVKVESVSIDPVASLPKGQLYQLTAIAHYSDGKILDVTADVLWETSNGAVLSVRADGEVRGEGPGAANISATIEGVKGSTQIMVRDAELVSLAIPAITSVAKGLDREVAAIGTFTDMTEVDLSDQVTWSTSDSSIATIDASGVAHGVATGQITITATSGSISATAGFQVTAAVLTSLEVSPGTTSVANGFDADFTAEGTFSDGATDDLTDQVAWMSSTGSVATIDAAGHAESVGVGTTTITASMGTVNDTASFEVTSATLQSLEVTFASPSVAKGLTVQATAMGTFSDGSESDITQMVVWDSELPNIAGISNGAGTRGRITALNVGESEITASMGAVEDSADITVDPAAVTGLVITPPTPTVVDGLTIDLEARATYTDGQMLDVSEQATWMSSSTTLADVSNTAGTRGRVLGKAAGMPTISADVPGFSASVMVTVTPAELLSITISPDGASFAPGTTIDLEAEGMYTDGTRDITSQVMWSSSAPSITISSTGVASATGDAVATITAMDTASGVSDTTTLTAMSVAEIHLAFAGGSFGDILVEDITDSVSLMTCSAACDVTVPVGHDVQLTAVSPSFTGFAGCSASENVCTLTATADETITTTFALDPGHAWQRLLYPGEIVFAADYDSVGHLLIGTTNHVAQLDLDGSTIWEISMPARQLRVGPSDSVYVISGTNLVKLDSTGGTTWTRALGTVGPQPDTLQFVDRLDVGADGVAAVSGASTIATWAADGTPGWTASIPAAGNDWYGVAIDSAGNVWAAVDDEISGDRTWALGFTAAGVAIPTELTPNNQYHGMIVADAAGHITFATSGHGTVRLDRRSQSNVSDFSLNIAVGVPEYAENGVAIANGNFFWAHDPVETCCAVGFVARSVTPTGTVSATVTRTAHNDIGVRPYTVAGHSSGRRAIAGEFWGPSFSRIGWIQAYAP